MLKDSPIAAIVPAKDLVRAKDFYQNKLGLKMLPMEFDDPLIFEAGFGTRLVVYYKAEGTKAEHTAVGFNVSDVEDVVEKLKAKGVVFEDYDNDRIKSVNHIVSFDSSKSAFFKDSEGNILSLNQM